MTKFLLLVILIAGPGFTGYAQNTFNTGTPSQQISFGKGGGFVGTVSTYTLTKKGQVYETTPVKGELWEMKKITKIKRKISKQIFRDASNLIESDLDFNNPGNMYYFLEINNGEIIKRYTWGDVNVETPNELVELYNDLKSIHTDEMKSFQ